MHFVSNQRLVFTFLLGVLAHVHLSSSGCPPCGGGGGYSHAAGAPPIGGPPGGHTQHLRPSLPGADRSSAVPTPEDDEDAPSPLDAEARRAAAALNPDPGRIVGGTLSKGNSWPWAAALVQEDGGAGGAGVGSGRLQYCGASILNNLYILTAAHCVYDVDSSKIANQYVYVGDHKLNGSHVAKYKVQSIIMHPLFKRQTLDNDVALVRVTTPIDFNRPNVSPVCVPRSGGGAGAGGPPVGQPALVVGWGSIKNNGPTVNSQRQVQVRIVPRGECRRSYSRDGITVTGNMICATAARKDSCAGDSGGPLMVRRGPGRFEQVGIVSFGKSCALRHFPGIYTNLQKYAAWIEQNSRDGSRC